MAALDLAPKRPGEFRIAHLSDLHLAHEGAGRLRRHLRGLLKIDNSRNGPMFRAVVRDILDHDIDHVLVTGDLTQSGRRTEFQEVRAILSPFETAGKLTVIPGNHDITYRREDRSGRLFRRLAKLDPFLEHFGGVVPSENPYGLPMRRGRPFPFVKIFEPAGIALIAIDTTNRLGVRIQPLNSLGHIDGPQRKALEQILVDPALARYTRIVAMHHHPMIIPLFPAGDSMRRLRQSRWLMPLLYETRVRLVMHGHKHVPFCWQSTAYGRHPFAVVCASAPNVAGSFAAMTEIPLVYNVYGISGGDVSIHYREFMFRAGGPERLPAP